MSRRGAVLLIAEGVPPRVLHGCASISKKRALDTAPSRCPAAAKVERRREINLRGRDAIVDQHMLAEGMHG